MRSMKPSLSEVLIIFISAVVSAVGMTYATSCKKSSVDAPEWVHETDERARRNEERRAAELEERKKRDAERAAEASTPVPVEIDE